MSDNEGQRIEDMRYELGRDAAQKGEPLHDSASEEFRNGYSSYRGGSLFGSNVAPRLFGRGGNSSVSYWYCVCGEENRSNRIARKGGEEVCWTCGVQRSYCEDHDRNENELDSNP